MSSQPITTLEIIAPDDWHVHLRQNDLPTGHELETVLPWTARVFRRAVVMPNLHPPLVDLASVQKYKEQILSQRPSHTEFTPLMTLFLTDNTSAQELDRGLSQGIIVAAKLYPARATTNSSQGVTNLAKLNDCWKALIANNRPLLVHGEVTDPHVDVFDREKVFIERELIPLREKFPDLKIVFEHITTRHAVDFVRQSGGKVGATITPHHLLLNRNAMFDQGLRPHAYCLPVLKREEHRLALVEAATQGEPYFFLGTDSAPHAKENKESACGCAGIFSAPGALSHYLEVFEEAGQISQFEKFASLNGPQFYGLPQNKHKLKLVRKEWKVPQQVSLVGGTKPTHVLLPFRAGMTLKWSVEV